MEDIFDIVDEKDQVIGAAARSQVHAEGKLHRAVHIWLCNQGGEVLLQLRSAAKDRHPSVWDSSACGHVDSGEDYATAAYREMGEELGLKEVLGQGPALEEIAYCADTEELDQEFVRIYRGRSEGPFQPQPSEVADLRWLGREELGEWMQREPESFAPSFLHLWRKYSHLLGA
jgi:isopentenyl-diphosphate delta-isomerase type 1